ncbi:hypothetical protein BAE44_0019765 [Dichanthelium oligosanthes]|uniref:SMP domain-containing protein n=1 Tax=Dichanthelium oligosanthes TaxID=888268 RepID=A0A1E5V2A6_9POAL|nr:hypothetical protein BAE44_0019765 [Dichanthelium oligosanthes]
MSQDLPGRPGDVDDDACRKEEPAATETVTIGQALQAAALSWAGDRPVDRADASAVEAAEKSATGLGGVLPWASRPRHIGPRRRTNVTKPPTRVAAARRMMTLRDVLGDASAVMPAGGKAATWVDAEKVAAATGRGGGGMGEVADAVAAAAHINEGSTL